MNKGYRSSQVFANLKGIKEAIGKNYSSSQLVQVLDILLFNAVAPITTTSLYNSWIPRILIWYSLSPNRKISAVDRKDLTTIGLMYQLAPVNKRLGVLKKLRLERNLHLLVIKDFLSITQEYRRLTELMVSDMANRERYAAQCKQIEELLGSDSTLYSKIAEVESWYNYYITFHGYMTEKYIRLALLKSKETYIAFQHQPDYDDVIQHHLLAIGKAIDKFDVELGSLSSYVGTWFQNARSQVKKEMLRNESSYETLVEGGIELGSSALDAANIIEKSDTINRVRLLAKLVDPHGFGRIKLGLEEIL